MSSNSVFALLGVLVFLTFVLERVLREVRRARDDRAFHTMVQRVSEAVLPFLCVRLFAEDTTPSCGRRCTQPVPSYFDAFLAAKPADSSGGLP